MVTLTVQAAQRVRSLLREQNKIPETYGLRIQVKGGGCAGFQYVFDLDTPQDDDLVYMNHGVLLIVDKKSILRLVGTEVTYHETIMESAFKVTNPNATSTCGCGISFGVNP